MRVALPKHPFFGLYYMIAVTPQLHVPMSKQAPVAYGVSISIPT